jgi:hypothetical protein
MFSSATSIQPAPMLSTLAWQDGEMVETDESSRRPLWKIREVRGRGRRARTARSYLLRLRKPRRAQNGASTRRLSP